VSVRFREIVLSKITRSEERDEREEYISGRASKATFLLSLAIMIVLFFLSGIQFNMYRSSKEERINGAKGTIGIGYQFEFVEKKTEMKNEKKGTIINYKGIPFSKEAIILFLMLFHVGGYHFFTRKRLKE